jgi:spermidine synthase
LVDIDKKVIEVSKRYLPSVSQGAFDDKRLKIFNEDALKFIKNYKNFFDIIICDSTDPYGPSKLLWRIGFYKDISRALKENGIAAFQTAYLKEKFAKKARKKIKEVFPFFKMHKAFVGCFPFDEHTFSFGSKNINFDRFTFEEINKKFKKLNLKTKYYSPEIHFSSTILPKYTTEKSK